MKTIHSLGSHLGKKIQIAIPPALTQSRVRVMAQRKERKEEEKTAEKSGHLGAVGHLREMKEREGPCPSPPMLLPTLRTVTSATVWEAAV